MRKPIIHIAAVAVTAALVAACGGSSHSTASSAAAPAAASVTAKPKTANGAGTASGATTKLSISAPKSGQLMFSTNKLSAKAGTVEITFSNPAPEVHNFTLAQGSKVLAATPRFKGGSKTITVHLTAGTYTYYCDVPGHRQAGMQGTLTVS